MKSSAELNLFINPQQAIRPNLLINNRALISQGQATVN